jgi:hypothetical protein
VKKALIPSFVFGLALIGAAGSPAAAQSPVPGAARSLAPLTFPRWDAGGSFGLLAITTTDTRSPWGGWEQKADYRFDLGRYWTTHLKTEVAVTASNPWENYESERLFIPGVPSPYAYTEIDRQLFTVAPAITWQFRENTFVHPYVSGGVKVGVLQEHRHREATTQRSSGVSYDVPPIDERRSVILARPFVAGGFKSYMSRSVFVRTELRMAFAQDGTRQVSTTAGIGVDF